MQLALSARELTLHECLAGARRFPPIVGQDLELRMEALIQVLLPLCDETAGTGGEAAVQMAANQQFLDIVHIGVCRRVCCSTDVDLCIRTPSLGRMCSTPLPP